MNSLDFIILVMVGFCIIRGFFTGVIKELSSIIGVIGGFFAAHLYYPQLSHMLSGWVSTASYRDMIAFSIVFCAVFSVAVIVGIILKYLLKVILLGWADHLFGVAFGFVKGILLVSVLLLVLTSFLPKGSSFLEHSTLAGRVNMVSEQMAKLVSREMRDEFNVKIKDLKSAWKIQQK
jgi:membrane protein required for colicin V production